jgi:hypothetical protein
LNLIAKLQTATAFSVMDINNPIVTDISPKGLTADGSTWIMFTLRLKVWDCTGGFIEEGATTERVLWDDLTFPFTQTKQGANLLPDFDYTNLGLLFDRNKPTEIVYMIAQFPHKRKLGAEVRPHIHWQQSEATVPVFKMSYKWVLNGGLVPADWTTVAITSNAFTYTSGNLAQISKWAALTPPEGDAVSTMLLIKLFRDDNTLPASALAFEFDIHYQIDSDGSRQEYVK